MTPKITHMAKPSFRVSERQSGFLDLVGPLYVDDSDPAAPVYGLEVDERHTNRRGRAHGGLLTTLADVALGRGALAAHGEARPLVTTSLTVDYVEAARLGDWLEARTTLQRMGSRLAFATCEITAGDRLVASCRGVFSVVDERPADATGP